MQRSALLRDAGNARRVRRPSSARSAPSPDREWARAMPRASVSTPRSAHPTGRDVLLLLGRRQLELGAPGLLAAIGHEAGLFDVGEERLHGIEVLALERIELVIVAFGAAHGAAQPDDADVAHAIGSVLREILFRLQTALGRGAIQAIVGRCHLLIDGGVGHQVAGQLLAREAVERHVVAERLQNVVAIRPRGKNIVAVEAAGVRIAHGIEPVHGLLFGIARRGEQAVDHLLIGVRRNGRSRTRELLRASAAGR